MYRFPGRGQQRRCIDDTTPDDIGPVWSLGINGPGRQRGSVSQEEVRVCARRLRARRLCDTEAGSLRDVRPGVRADGQALRFQVQTTDALSQEARLHDHGRLLLRTR
jgi:hypothetical protein